MPLNIGHYLVQMVRIDLDRAPLLWVSEAGPPRVEPVQFEDAPLDLILRRLLRGVKLESRLGECGRDIAPEIFRRLCVGWKVVSPIA